MNNKDNEDNDDEDNEDNDDEDKEDEEGEDEEDDEEEEDNEDDDDDDDDDEEEEEDANEAFKTSEGFPPPFFTFEIFVHMFIVEVSMACIHVCSILGCQSRKESRNRTKAWTSSLGQFQKKAALCFDLFERPRSKFV